MKKLVLVALIGIGVLSCKDKAQKVEEINTASNEEKSKVETNSEKDWTVLFDGTSFEHWKGFATNEVHHSWKLEDGAMVFYPPKERKEKETFDIVTKNSYVNFVLSLEWKISEGGNSGVFWGVKEGGKFDKPYQTGPEIQVLDNEKHPDAKNGNTHQAGSLYDMIAASEDATKAVGEWNTYVISVNHKTNEGSVVLNGKEIVTFPLHGEAWDKMVAKSKFADWEGFGKFSLGKIGLQDHGDIVAYRNIKIKTL
ncbi:3-keto-disaccharide hydrolase [Spongiimicrobium salis]|uniref:3-keto-disaccharide hydrolase n=1 Tax=Spongiimicrobium salis TaxID=1667022 RepID=UPI00374CC44F